MSDGIIHHKVKERVAHALQAAPGVTGVEIERRFGPVQADVSFCLEGKRGAVEIQLSDKPRAEIDNRTRCYHELGVHVIWVLREERTICEGGRLVVYDWEEYLHALYFGVVYHWAGGQLLQPLYLERRRNLNRRYFDKKRDRWASPYYEQIRTPWFLDTIRITDLSPEIRPPGRFGQYTLPAAHLWCLPRKAHQKKYTLLDDWRWGVFSPPMVEETVCRSLSEARSTSSIAIRTFGKKNSSLAESDQRVRHGERVQPCLTRSYAGPEYMREPGSVSMECPLVRERAARHISQRPSKINHRHASSTSASYFARVMQDKGLLNFVARICTTLPIPPVMCWHDMYSIYTFLL